MSFLGHFASRGPLVSKAPTQASFQHATYHRREAARSAHWGCAWLVHQLSLWLGQACPRLPVSQLVPAFSGSWVLVPYPRRMRICWPLKSDEGGECYWQTKQFSGEREQEGGLSSKVGLSLSQCGWIWGFFGLRIRVWMLIGFWACKKVKTKAPLKGGHNTAKNLIREGYIYVK